MVVGVELVSVAEGSTLSVWKVAADVIPRYIQADIYRVIVPDEQVDTFRNVTNPRFLVEPESEYSSNFSPYLRRATSLHNFKRYGWYLQQLIKIEALKRLAEKSERAVIWDADTVPLKTISYFDGERTKFFFSKENHAPYFKAIDRLLGLNRTAENSFITQSFPCRPHWTQGFLDAIESRHRVPWWRAVIDSTDFRDRSGFSEYESLGTYLSHSHPEEWEWRPEPWTRYGYSYFETPEKAVQLSGRGKTDFAFAAFERGSIRATSPLRRLVNRNLRRVPTTIRRLGLSI